MDVDRIVRGLRMRRVREFGEGVELRVLSGYAHCEVDAVQFVLKARHPSKFADHDGIEFGRTRGRAADDVDPRDVPSQWCVDAVIDIAAVERLDVAGQESKHIDGDVPLTDHGHS
jgi:hypothetical protein